jgi:hypothetical protein
LKKLLVSLASTASEISRRSPDGATDALRTVMATGPLPSSGRVRPFSWALTILLTSVKGRSIGTPMEMLPLSIAGTISSKAGKGQFGDVMEVRILVSASTPRVRTRLAASTRGCAAIALVGRISRNRSGTPGAALGSGIVRHILAHSRRAFCSIKGSLRMRCCIAATCSPTALSSTGLTCAGTPIRTPPAVTPVSPTLTWAVMLGSRRQRSVSSGRALSATLPRISALALKALMEMLPSCLPMSPPIMLLMALPALADSDPVTLSLPVSGVDSMSWLLTPAAVIAPRSTVQLMSAFCRICPTGLSAFPAKLCGAARSTEVRIAARVIATGVTIFEGRAGGGRAGSLASVGATLPGGGDSQFMTLRLMTNDTASVAAPISNNLMRMESPTIWHRF